MPRISKTTLRKAEEHPEKDITLDLSAPHVVIGPYTIQHTWGGFALVYGLPEDQDTSNVWRIVERIAETPGVKYTVQHTGAREEYGHGYETFSFVNEDNSLIWESRWVDQCSGPGYSCSYEHGPWFKYGEHLEARALQMVQESK